MTSHENKESQSEYKGKVNFAILALSLAVYFNNLEQYHVLGSLNLCRDFERFKIKIYTVKNLN